MSITPITNASVKIQTNLKPDLHQANHQSIGAKNPTSFSDHLMDALQSTAADGHQIEALSTSSNDASELAMAMDQFLIELNALKALVDETRKAIDRIFQEARS